MSSKPASSSTYQIGFQYWPVASITTWVTPSPASFANLLLPYQGDSVRAGLAPSWARQGIPMTAYAEQIRSRYEDAAR